MLHKLLGLLFLTLALFSSCYYAHPDREDNWIVSQGHEVDSLEFYIGHHYWTHYFFQAVDSLQLAPVPDYEKRLLLPVYNAVREVGEGDVLAVVAVGLDRSTTPSTVWVKVARDQQCQGWVKESELLERVVPDTPVSKFIHHFSNRSLLVVLLSIVLAVLFYFIRGARHKRLQIVHFNDIHSFYPTLLCLTVSLGAVIYGTIQCYAPETWVEYYFHPTLNPFDPNLPFILSAFLASVWLMLLVGIAVVDDLRHLPDISGSVVYLVGLAAVCMGLYMFFTLSVHIYIGYPLLAAYWAFAFYRHIKRGTPHYSCGNCGAPISRSGKCPECGANNEII